MHMESVSRVECCPVFTGANSADHIEINVTHYVDSRAQIKNGGETLRNGDVAWGAKKPRLADVLVANLRPRLAQEKSQPVGMDDWAYCWSLQILNQRHMIWKLSYPVQQEYKRVTSPIYAELIEPVLSLSPTSMTALEYFAVLLMVWLTGFRWFACRLCLTVQVHIVCPIFL